VEKNGYQSGIAKVGNEMKCRRRVMRRALLPMQILGTEGSSKEEVSYVSRSTFGVSNCDRPGYSRDSGVAR